MLEVIDASAMAVRDRPASWDVAARHGAVHVELRPADALHLAALLLAQHENSVGF